jgi:hypothetical protein
MVDSANVVRLLCLSRHALHSPLDTRLDHTQTWRRGHHLARTKGNDRHGRRMSSA